MFDWVGGTAGDEGSRGVEEVGFGFGVGGGEFVVVAREVEKIHDKILQTFKHFSVSFREKRSRHGFPRTKRNMNKTLRVYLFRKSRNSVPEITQFCFASHAVSSCT